MGAEKKNIFEARMRNEEKKASIPWLRNIFTYMHTMWGGREREKIEEELAKKIILNTFLSNKTKTKGTAATSERRDQAHD